MPAASLRLSSSPTSRRPLLSRSPFLQAGRSSRTRLPPSLRFTRIAGRIVSKKPSASPPTSLRLSLAPTRALPIPWSPVMAARFPSACGVARPLSTPWILIASSKSPARGSPSSRPLTEFLTPSRPTTRSSSPNTTRVRWRTPAVSLSATSTFSVPAPPLQT